MKPMPSRSQVGSSPCSALRRSHEYSLCSETNGVSPRSAAIAAASSTIAGVKLEEPIARTVPSWTSSCSASSVSSSGVTPSGRWYW